MLRLVYRELFDTGGSEIACGAVRQSDFVVIFSLFRTDQFPDKVPICVTAIEVAVIPGMLKRHGASLVEGYVGQRLPHRVEIELVFFLLIGVFVHDMPLYLAGGQLSQSRRSYRPQIQPGHRQSWNEFERSPHAHGFDVETSGRDTPLAQIRAAKGKRLNPLITFVNNISPAVIDRDVSRLIELAVPCAFSAPFLEERSAQAKDLYPVIA